jgi:hypothetical protein
MTETAETSKSVSKNWLGSSVGILILFTIASFLIYQPVVHRYFVSDDFDVLYRVCLEKTIFIKRFFRPLSDMSIYMNYQLGGFNPVVFNSFNILIHAINGWLVYLVCLSLGTRMEGKKVFAILAAAFFLCYPFHNEAVVWLLGRGASMACLFTLLSVICFYTIKKRIPQTISVSLFYFISLSAFESTMVFPIIFMFLLLFEKQNFQTIRYWMVVLLSTLVIHLLIRYQIAGSILGSYGQDFLHSGLKVYFQNIAKVGGRLLLPPSGNALFMILAFILLASTVSIFAFKYRNTIFLQPTGHLLLYLTGMLLISCIVPVITGVSTQTSETDRTIYFPSVFLCIIVAWIIVAAVKRRRVQVGVGLLIIVASLFFLEKNNKNWNTASLITSSIMEKIGSQKDLKENGRMFFLNIPNEVDGAFVFRLGFSDALKLNGFDSSRYIAVNYLPRQDIERMKKRILVLNVNRVIVLPPDIFLPLDSSGCRQIIDHGALKFCTAPGDQIYFWNLDRLEAVQACPLRNPG